MRRAWASRLGRRLLVAAALIAAWQGWLAYQAAAKMPPDLAAHVSARGTVDLCVTLRFPPERFHILTLQRYGRIAGTEGTAVELRSVPVGEVGRIARLYWIRAITPLREEER